jgi:hypothetical protein
MDYIVKDASDLKTRICECLRNAYDKYTAKCTPLQNNFVLKKSRDEIISIDSSQILILSIVVDTFLPKYLSWLFMEWSVAKWNK